MYAKNTIAKLVRGIECRNQLLEKRFFTKQNILKFSVAAHHACLGAYPWGNGWILSPDTPYEGAVPDFFMRNGIIDKKATAEKMNGSFWWSVLDPDKDVEGKHGFYFLRPSNSIEIAVDFGARRPIRSGWITRQKTLTLSLIDFYLMTGMTVKAYEIQRAIEDGRGGLPSFIMSAKITPSERYITLRTDSNFTGKLVKKSKNTSFAKTLSKAIKTGKEVFWRVDPVQRNTFVLPKEVLKVFGMPAEIFLPNEYDWSTGVLTVMAQPQRCACCGKVLPMKGQKMKRGHLCEGCYYTSQYLQSNFSISSDIAPSIANWLNELLKDPVANAAIIASIKKRLTRGGIVNGNDIVRV